MLPLTTFADGACRRCRHSVFPATRSHHRLALALAVVLATQAPFVLADEAHHPRSEASSTISLSDAASSSSAAAPGKPEAAASPDSEPVQGKTLSTIMVYGIGNATKLDGTATATGTYTPLIDIPFSIDAISSKLWREQGAQSLEDAVRNAPGVSVHQGEGNRDEFMLRGVKTKSDFFVNGMRDDTEYFRDLYNLSEVDVLKGPAALLFGRGNAGGVINLVTKKPEARRIREFGVDFGQWDRYRATADLGDRVGDQAAWRLNLMGERAGGFRQFARLRRYGIDPEFAFHLGSDTRLNVGTEHFYERRQTDRGIPSRDGHPVKVDRSRFFGSIHDNDYHARVDALHVRLEHDFSDDVQLRNMLRINRNQREYSNMYPASTVSAEDTLTMKGYRHANTRRTWDDRTELLAGFDTGGIHHQLLAGLQFTLQKGDDVKYSAAKIHDVPLSNPLVPGRYTEFDRNNHAVANETGVYVQDQIDLGQRWKAIAGVRRDRFSVRAHYRDADGTPMAWTRNVDTTWSPRGGLIFKPTKNDSVYVSATRTFTPQGANVALSTKSPEGQELGPERAINYELGNKLKLLDGNLAFTTSVYQLVQSWLTATNADGDLVQTGEARSRGVELALIGHLGHGWDVAANYTRMKTEYTHPTRKVAKGNEEGLIPRNQGSLWATWSTDGHWGLGGGVQGQSASWAKYTNQVRLPGFVRADAMAFYRSGAGPGSYRIQLNVNNLFDAHYYPTANDDNQIMPGAPRSVDLSVRYRF